MHPAYLVSKVCYADDKETRNELAVGIITSERDYMSALSARIRDSWKRLGLPAYSYSQTLPGATEQALGCDTVIVLRDEDGAKVCLVEAKWPRLFSNPKFRWDKIQKSNGSKFRESHFSSQLRRQTLILPQAAVWEMFLVETPSGTLSYLLDLYGSTCVGHSATLRFDKARRSAGEVWTSDQLWELMGSTVKNRKSLESFILKVASCQWGDALPIVNGSVVLSSSAEQGTITVPASLEQLENLAGEFCRRYGVSNFLVLQLEWLG